MKSRIKITINKMGKKKEVINTNCGTKHFGFITIILLFLLSLSFYLHPLMAKTIENKPIKTFKLVINEKYGDFKPPPSGTKRVHWEITKMLEHLGYTISDKSFDAIINITMNGHAVSAEYWNQGTLYTGASIQGKLSLKWNNVEESFDFSGEYGLTKTGFASTSGTPADAPFISAFAHSDFNPQFIDMLSNFLSIPRSKLLHAVLQTRPPEKQRNDYMNQIANQGEVGINELIDIFKNPDGFYFFNRKTALGILYKLKSNDPKIQQLFFDVFADKLEETNIRFAILKLFRDKKDNRMVPTIIKVINKIENEKTGFGEWFLRYPGEFDDDRLVLPLIEVLKSDKVNIDFRKVSAISLGSLGDKRSIPYLISFLKNQKNELAHNIACGALSDIVGIDYGNDSSKWFTWWEQQK